MSEPKKYKDWIEMTKKSRTLSLPYILNCRSINIIFKMIRIFFCCDVLFPQIWLVSWITYKFNGLSNGHYVFFHFCFLNPFSVFIYDFISFSSEPTSPNAVNKIRILAHFLINDIIVGTICLECLDMAYQTLVVE